MAKPLTVKAIENAKPGEKRYGVPDGDMPGLELIVQPSGAKSWAYRYRIAGAQRRLTLGTYPKIRLADARDLARGAARAAAEGNDPVERKKAAKEEKETLEGAAKLFVRRHGQEHNSNRHWRETARILGLKPDPVNSSVLIRTGNRDSIIAKWGKKPITSITEKDVIKMIDDVFDRGSPIMANRTRAALSKFFKWAKGRKIIDKNPCLETAPPAKERKRKRTLTDMELRALWRAAQRLGYAKGTAYRGLLLSGQRLNLIARCRTEYLDRKAELWTMPAEQEGSKGREHVLPIAASMAAVFDECRGNAPYLFSTTGGEKPLYMGSKLKDEIDALMLEEMRREAADRGENPDTVTLAPWGNHDIRRTVRTRLSALPVPEGDLVRELVIGHKKKDLHEVYDRYAYLDEKRAALDLWAAKLQSIVSPPGGNVVAFKTAAVL